MTTVIGYKGTPEGRYEHWQAMQLYRAGSIELLSRPDTISIALKDKERYKHTLQTYIN